MSLFERMERQLERTVNGVFARAFRAEVQPLELASAVRRAMDDRATLIGRGRTSVPNLFTIELSPADHDRLLEYDEELEDELIAAAQEHAETQRYRPGGPLQVLFEADDALETGVFRVRPATSRHRVQSRSAVREYQDDYRESEGEDYDEYSAPLPVQPGEDEAQWWDDEEAKGDEPAPSGRPADPPSPVPARPAEPERTQVAEVPPARQARVQDLPWLAIDGERYPLMSAMTVLGRDDSADVVLDDPGISRRHAEVRVTHDGPRQVAHLRDLGSTNGTYVNGDPVDACPLHDGDRVTMGRTSVTFHLARR